MKVKKVLVLGSGAIRIGQAGEFDYSGSQCIKALREEGIKVILINPNIATIQTSKELADKVYFLPVRTDFVEKVIQKEKPDGIMLMFGGQTALNCGVELHEQGILRKHNVKVLGTPVESIILTEDRKLFARKLREIGVKTPKSRAVRTMTAAINAAKKIGYPVMVRAAYALGGKGSGVAKDERELEGLADKALSAARQILVEEYLGGWKEIEYEVVRDSFDNCITVCNMENFDPLGIHTGESIVVAPSQTLTDKEYHSLRTIAIKVIRALGIVGECNIQYALDPNSDDYRIIEVNARLSRSSALASKATGYPLAFIAAKLGLGHNLTELPNMVTKKTFACFEPALDYLVLKIPRWDLEKFRRVKKQIGTEMKSVGEVMAIGRKFEEALQKAIRMLGQGMNGLTGNTLPFDNLSEELRQPTDKRVFAVGEAVRQGRSIEEIHRLSGIDPWFLAKIQNIIGLETDLSKGHMTASLLRRAKRYGFSDRQIGLLQNKSEEAVYRARKKRNILPVIRQIDTLAAEYPAKTNYLYLTYNGQDHDITSSEKKTVIVLGSGAYRIGSSVEFDWCAVTAVQTLKKLGYHTVMINYNPETVSTDYDICDRLYFDELSFETVRDIYEMEQPLGLILSVGGQIPNNLAMACQREGMRILGTSPQSIDNAENRHRFSAILDRLGIDQPPWKELTTVREAKRFAEKVGYPVLIRPSYVLSGSAMNVAFDDRTLERYLKEATEVSKEHPVVITRFIMNAKEIEIDAVAKKGTLVAYAISEHIENAGVHSGDATMVFPPQNLYLETIRRIKRITKAIAKEFNITGPLNIQFIAKKNRIGVIELNLRASRSFPFVSKVSKVNFIGLATKAIMGKRARTTMSMLNIDYVGVKAPQFSFSRLSGADPVLSVEMSSTGEVACMGDDLNEAFLKAVLAVDMNLPRKDVLVSVGGERNKYRALEDVRKLHQIGYRIYATEHTAAFLRKRGIRSTMLYKAHNRHKKDNVLSYLKTGKIDLAVFIADEFNKDVVEDEYLLRRTAVDFSVPLVTNLQLFHTFVDALADHADERLQVKSWGEYK
ncbi:MAG: carbamoyl-phosphate synthase (glutamine-hydrolyzing) large subunit [DPANN group archaeon]|nr:carbamoyl-phosphate synthase (glutamine-hydrolyzing) large subunit [DPANN group archaeon]